LADSLIPSSDISGRARENLQKRRELDQQSLEALLRALDPDRDRAASLYAHLFERLRSLFEWNGFEPSDALADQTLDRLALRLSQESQGVEPVREPARFAAGIARMIMQETRRNEQRMKEAAEEFQQGAFAYATGEKERISAILNDCLERISADRRLLIERYYSSDARNHIGVRAALAKELKISLNALRNRAGRIRADLENCIRRRRENDRSR
jgi:hypothetical protein